MKKNYAKPSTIVIAIKNGTLLNASLGNGQAAVNATVLSREDRGGGSSWDDDED